MTCVSTILLSECAIDSHNLSEITGIMWSRTSGLRPVVFFDIVELRSPNELHRLICRVTCLAVPGKSFGLSGFTLGSNRSWSAWLHVHLTLAHLRGICPYLTKSMSKARYQNTYLQHRDLSVYTITTHSNITSWCKCIYHHYTLKHKYIVDLKSQPSSVTSITSLNDLIFV